MLNQARIALLAAILLCVAYVYSFASQALTLVSSGGATLSYAAGLLLRFLMVLALPAMLAVWFRSGTAITLSRKLRWWALGTAIVFGVFFTALPLLGWLIAIIGGWSPAGWMGATAAASNPERWSNAALWQLPHYLSQLALVLLLIAMIRRPGGAVPERNSGSGLLRNVALAATIAAGVAIVLNTFGLVNAMMQGGYVEHNGPAPLQVLGFAVDSLPPLCRLMIPLFVYKSLTPAPSRQVWQKS